MKNRQDTGVFLRIYHRSDLKSRLDSRARSIFLSRFAPPNGFSFSGSIRSLLANKPNWNLVKIWLIQIKTWIKIWEFYFFSFRNRPNLLRDLQRCSRNVSTFYINNAKKLRHPLDCETENVMSVVGRCTIALLFQLTRRTIEPLCYRTARDDPSTGSRETSKKLSNLSKPIARSSSHGSPRPFISDKRRVAFVSIFIASTPYAISAHGGRVFANVIVDRIARVRELMPLDDTPVPWTCSSSAFIDDNVFLECCLPLRASTAFRSMPEFDAKIETTA